MPTFAGAAGSYWLAVFPAVNREVSRWEARARTIPDPVLRALALTALRRERGNLEGAAAFAAFLPAVHRVRVVQALVAFQAAYDYADALCEQPNRRPMANARRLHDSLLGALGCDWAAHDCYRHNGRSDDGGYLSALVSCCRESVRMLPSYTTVASMACRAAERIAAYQTLNMSESQGGRAALERWARANTPTHTGLCWWETAAAAGSSLLVFALVATATRPALEEGHMEALADAYFPWIGALHTLLDSLVDQSEDARSGHRSLLDYYGSPGQAAGRLETIAAEAVHHAGELPDGVQHLLILAAMASFYLSDPCYASPHARMVRAQVLAAMGQLAAPTMLVMGARHHAARLRRRAAARHRGGPPAPARGCGGAPHG